MKKIKIIVITLFLGILCFFLGAYTNNEGYINLISKRSYAKLSTISDGGKLDVVIDTEPLLMDVSLIDSELQYKMYYLKEMNYIKEQNKEIFKVNDLTMSIELFENTSIDDLISSSQLIEKDINKNKFLYNSINTSNEIINENYYIEINDHVYKISLNYPISYSNKEVLKINRCLETLKFK